MTKKTRDKNDLIIVQEKIDGSNCAVAKLDGKILALSRAGYMAHTSPYKQHAYFSLWVEKHKKRFFDLLNDGERVVGEWIIQAHGTRYELTHEPFVVFDIMTEHERMTYHDFILRVLPYGFVIPKLVHIGQPLPLEEAKKMIKKSGHGAIDEVEGVVYRCERNKKVDFLCKWVRPDKIDGIYLPERNGGKVYWNYNPKFIT